MNVKGAVESLRGLTAIPILEHAVLANLTSWRVGGPTDLLIRVSNFSELKDVLDVLSETGVPRIVLGNGTNVLFSDRGYRGAVIKLVGVFEECSVDDEAIEAGGGTSLKGLVELATENSLTGLEFAAGIPGTVGGALRSNAGAYDCDIGSLVRRVRVAENGAVKVLKSSDIEFGYRHSSLVDDQVILGVTLKLRRGDKSEIGSEVEKNLADRSSKHPLEFRTAGSVFKNPGSGKAVDMIMGAGLTGKSVGGAQISTKHSNFIVNKGDAKAKDIKSLIELVQENVRERFGVELEPEVRVIGEF